MNKTSKLSIFLVILVFISADFFAVSKEESLYPLDQGEHKDKHQNYN